MTWQHNPLETLRISSSTKDSLRLSWQVTPYIENAVGGYQIRYRASGSSITQYSGKLDRMLRTWEISQLHENTDYEICFWTFLSSDTSNITNDYQYLNNTNNSTDLVARRSYEMLQDDPLFQNNSSPYCFESSTGVDAAKVAFVSTLGAFFAIGIVLFFVLLARWQESSRKKVGTKKNGEEDEEEEEEEDEKVARSCRRRRKRRKACRQCRGQQKEHCQCNKGFFSAFKVSKAFKVKRASSKQVLAHDSTPSHHHSSPHHHQSPHHYQSPHHFSNDGSCKEAKSDKTSLHSSLLSLINEEPGNMFLVATSSDDKKGDENKDEDSHELAYLIPIMKCQDGTLILGGTDDDGNEGDAEDDDEEEDGDSKKSYFARQDNACEDDVVSDENEDDDDDDDEEECSDDEKKDFELLPIIFSPQLKLSVVDSVFMGDIVAVENEEEENEEKEEEEKEEEENDVDEDKTKAKSPKEDDLQDDEFKNGATHSFISKAKTSECILDKQEDGVAIRRTSSNVMPKTSI